MSDPALLFDGVAADYDRFRPTYPAALVDEACAELPPGAPVLEIGCGTGQLTTALVERGLRVSAIDPGPHMVEIARGRAPSATFAVARFEDAQLPDGAFAAAFSATAFHWVDPDVGWAKVARVLRPGGRFALLWLIGELGEEELAAWREVYPDAANWESRDPEAVLEGAGDHGGNVSELWSWLGSRDVARAAAADLFCDVAVATATVQRAQSAAELLGEVGTTSAYLRMDADRQRRLRTRLEAMVNAAGGVHRTSSLATLVTARVPA